MQREIGLSENAFLNAVARLKDAIAAFNEANRELKAATQSYEEAEHALVPEIPEHK